MKNIVKVSNEDINRVLQGKVKISKLLEEQGFHQTKPITICYDSVDGYTIFEQQVDVNIGNESDN